MPNLPNTFDYLSPRIWLEVIQATQFPKDYIGAQFFPNRQVPGPRLEWDYIFDENRLAPFTSPGAEAPHLDPEQILTKGYADVPCLRYKSTLRVEDVMWLRTWGSSQNVATPQGAMAAAARAEITRRADILSNSIDARKEWMSISTLLGSMVVSPTLPENAGLSPITFTVNYPIRTVTASPLWSDATNGDPYLDMRSWFNTIAQSDRPWVPRIAIMSSRVFYAMALSQKISRQMFLASRATDAGLPSILTDQQLTVFFGNLGLRVILYDTRYTDRTYQSDGSYTINVRRFMPDNKVIFLPEGPMGFMAQPPSPQNNWQTGKFALTVTPEDSGRVDPWVYEMVAGEWAMPVMLRPDRVLVATVLS